MAFHTVMDFESVLRWFHNNGLSFRQKMGKKKEQKIIHYIRSGKVKRLRKFVKKHNVKIGSVQLPNGLSVLHLACQYLNEELVEYLLKHKTPNALLKDKKGNVALLTAMKNALRTPSSCYAYNAVVLPLLKYCPEALFIPNKKGEMAKTILKELEDRCNLQAQESKFHKARINEIDDWTRKLQAELEDEVNQEMFWGEDDYCDWESFDNWASRISQEYSRKKEREKRACYQGASSSKRTTNENRWTAEDQAEFDRKCLQEEENRKKYKAAKEKKKMMKLKEHYEMKCHMLFGLGFNSSIHLEDVPKPSSEFIQYLLCDIEELSSQQQYLREQQIQWHPDKFLQKCSNRLKRNPKRRF